MQTVTVVALTAFGFAAAWLAEPLASQDGARPGLFQSTDLAPRRTVANELDGLLERRGDLQVTTGLAAVIGTALPPDSAAAGQLRVALQRANAAARDDGGALATLRSDLGDLVAVLTFEPLIEAEVPTGFPVPTVAGELEIRDYPAYKMAQTAMDRGGSTGAFWPLFQHIKSNDIAMTTPVQMDWPTDRSGADDSEATTARPASMAFLYGDRSIQPKRTAAAVEVVEVEPKTVLSLGAIGSDRPARVAAMKRRLTNWLQRPTCPYEAAGPFRTMGYNSPMVRGDRRYFELQVPVRPRSF